MRLERFSKNELNQRGYKLVFFDLSALFNLMNDTNKIDEFKKSNMRPVVNLLLFSELLKGLDPAHKDYEKNYQNKKNIMRFFDDMSACWILSHDEIVSFEFVHAYHGKYKKDAHGYFKIFCASPVFVQLNGSGERSYSCDNLMKFSYGLYNEARTYQELLVNNYSGALKREFNSGVNNNNEAKHRTSLDLAKAQEGKLKIIKEYVEYFLNWQNIFYTKNKLKDLTADLCRASQQFSFLSYAPFFSVEEAIYWKYIEKYNTKPEKNDFLDSIHARTALSYCDYFIADDKILKEVSDEIINEMQLKVKCEALMNFEIKSDRAHVLQD